MRQRVRHALGRSASLVAIVGFLASLMAIAPVGPLTQAAHATTGTITEFRPTSPDNIIQNSSSDPLGIVSAGGNLWITDAGEDLSLQGGTTPPPKQIGRFKLSDQSLQYFPNAEPGSVPVAVAAAPDGNVWFANNGTFANDVGAVNLQGALIGTGSFPVGIPASQPTDITAGPTGDLHMYFTLFGSGNIGRINLDGSGIATFKLPGGRSATDPPTATVTQNPQSIVPAGGKLWFTIQKTQSIGTIDTGLTPGSYQEFPTTLPNLAGITPGADGNLWFTAEGDFAPGASTNRPIAQGNGKLGKITPAGVVTSFLPPSGAPTFAPNAITSGPDGNLWFIDVGDNLIWRFNPFTSAFTSFPVPRASAFSGNVQPTGITVGPDSNIWFTENNAAGAIVRLTVDSSVTLSPSPMDFGSQLPNTPMTQNITVANATALPVAVNSPATISGANAPDFTITGQTCTVALTPSPANCTYTIQFKPSAIGSRTAQFNLSAADSPVPHTVQLNGIGRGTAPTFGPANNAYPDTPVGSASKATNFSLTNITGVPITVSSATLGGTNPKDFTITGDTCSGRSVADASSCAVSVAFTPSTTGVRSATLTLADSAAGSPRTANLSGNGTPSTTAGNGYWEVASDGGIFNYGSAKFFGSAGSIKLNQPIVGMARTASGSGYWLVATDGGIFNYCDAKFFGSAGAIKLNKPIVGMAPTPTGNGYWLVASDGGIFTYGDAKFYGSAGSIKLNKPIVGMAPAANGSGYWLVATDGGIFNYGSAGFFGSAGAIILNKPIVGMAASSNGLGYWLVATDGGIFNYGSAGFFGSAGAIRLNKPIVSMAASNDGQGYWLSATDGGIFNYGDAKFFGSAGAINLNKPMVAMAAAP